MARILVIDDQKEILDLLRRYLTATGHEVVTADSGHAGRKLFEQSPVDVVVTDIFMPDQDGLEMIMAMRRHYPEVKVIAISGGGTLGNIDILQAAQRLGASAVFEKPFDLVQLADKIRALTDGSDASSGHDEKGTEEAPCA